MLCVNNFNQKFFDSKNIIETETKINVADSDWYLEIPKINLKAKIKDGTNEEVLDEYIGHFSNTPVKIGNVCFAAHNRGYKNNYFSKLKELRINDYINYYINEKEFVYKVNNIITIKETDWSMLKNTNDNRLTLITCIENKPEYRLCVQAVRVVEEE